VHTRFASGIFLLGASSSGTQRASSMHWPNELPQIDFSAASKRPSRVYISRRTLRLADAFPLRLPAQLQAGHGIGGLMSEAWRHSVAETVPRVILGTTPIPGAVERSDDTPTSSEEFRNSAYHYLHALPTTRLPSHIWLAWQHATYVSCGRLASQLADYKSPAAKDREATTLWIDHFLRQLVSWHPSKCPIPAIAHCLTFLLSAVSNLITSVYF
jgi:hypothetical protein